MMRVSVSVVVCLSTLVCNVHGMTYAVAIPGFELQTDGQPTGTYKAVMINTGSAEITVDIEKGEEFSTAYEYDHSPTPATREIKGLDVLKFRVHVCGEAVIKLEQGTDDTLVVRLTTNNTVFDLCHGDSCVRSEMELDGYNTQFMCSSDMAIYWIKQTKLNDTSILFCFGVGPVSDKTTDCTDNTNFTTNFQTTDGNLFDRYSVVGINSDAFFLTDLESSSGCAVHVSDWRCEDKLQNCSKYEPGVCDSKTDAFTADACKKYCGKCEVDSYGKKFLVVFPHYSFSASTTKCYLTVAIKDDQSNARVSVATKTQVLSADPNSTSTTFLYDCLPYIDNTIIIRSNVDVAVSALYWINDKVLAHNVYPVDAYGKEYMAFTAYTSQQNTYCKIVSENEGVSVVPQYNGLTLNDGADQPLEDGRPFILDSEFSLVINEGVTNQSVLLLFSDQPIGVFCGTELQQSIHPDSFNQLIPIDVLGSLYHTPALGTSTASRPFNGELQIQAFTPNTFVSVEGDFNANYSLISTGQVERVVINLGSSYAIRSNHPVAVGLYVKNAADADAIDANDKLASFHVLPPVASFGTDTLFFSPMRVLDTLFQGFGSVSSLNSYIINSTQGSSRTMALTNLNEAFVRGEVSGKAFGLTVAIGSSSQWFVMPTYSSFVPYSNTNPPCHITTAVPGDGIDNDCDSLTDEDVCYVGYGVYGEDRDLDGDYNDDCLSATKTEPTIEPKVDEPVCLIINKTVGQCWTVCSCKCSWVKNYEAMQNLTTEEFTALQKEKSEAVQDSLKIKTDGLSSETAKLGSAEDERQSAANIGYLGIGLFAVVFGTIFIMDISALLRDMKTFCTNFRHGIRRMCRSCR